jgi:hypothetical protein
MRNVVSLFTLAVVLAACATVPPPALRAADVAQNQPLGGRCDFDDICGSGICDDNVCRDPIPRPNGLRDSPPPEASRITLQERRLEAAPRAALYLHSYPAVATHPSDSQGRQGRRTSSGS